MHETIDDDVTTREGRAPSCPGRLRPGDEILGRYVVEGELGQGGMGVADLLANGGVSMPSGHREILVGGQTYLRCCSFDTRAPDGTVLFFR